MDSFLFQNVINTIIIPRIGRLVNFCVLFIFLEGIG